MTPRRMGWRFALIFWAVFGVVSGFQVWISMITHGHSVPRLIFYYVAISEGWLLATVGIVWLVRRLPVVPLRRLPVLVHFLAACVIAVLHSLYWVGLLIAIKPYDRMSAETAEIPIAAILFFRVPLELILYCMVLGAAMAFEFYER